MYKNILVPISFDEERDSTQAIETAVALSDAGASITLLHVMEDIPSYAQTYLSKDHIANSRKLVEDTLAERASAVVGGKAVVINGHSGKAILEFAKEQNNDLVVIASHRPAMADYFLGSTAHHVVRHANCAVHVVR